MNYLRKRKARGGRKSRGRRDEKEDAPGKETTPVSPNLTLEKEADPVVYVEAPLPKVNPWKKSVTPDPPGLNNGEPNLETSKPVDETKPLAETKPVEPKPVTKLSAPKPEKESNKRSEPRGKRGPREERKVSKREGKGEKEPKEVKVEKEVKGEDVKEKKKVLPPAPKSNPWKKVPGSDPPVSIKEAEPKVFLFNKR